MINSRREIRDLRIGKNEEREENKDKPLVRLVVVS